MKSLRLLLTASLLAPALLRAQDDEEKPVIDLAERKASIPILEQNIADRRERMTEHANDILALDRRLEQKVQKVVDRLASIKDSTESGYRVSQIKAKAMEGLKNTIENYQSKRASLIQEIREGRTGIPKEVLEKDAEIFDEHIEKRVEQILEISKSFTQNQDVEKYEEVEGSDWGWGWGPATRISDEYRQNRRDRTMDKKQRDEMVAALEKSVERYKSLVAGMRDSLANRTMSDAERELMQAELNRNVSILDTRQSQLEELTMVEQPLTAAVDRDTAQDLQEGLREAAADMRQDFEAIFVKYAQLNAEREKMYKLEKNLEARKKWIADYEAEQKE